MSNGHVLEITPADPLGRAPLTRAWATVCGVKACVYAGRSRATVGQQPLGVDRMRDFVEEGRGLSHTASRRQN